MSQYSETIGSFTRTGNYPLEANYIFESEDALKQFYSDPIAATTLHEGLLKIVKTGTDGKQALYWVVNGENGLEFKVLIEDLQLDGIENQINDILQKIEDIYGTDDPSQIPEELNNILNIVNAIKELQTKLSDIKKELKAAVGTDQDDIKTYLQTLAYKSITELSEVLHTFLQTTDPDNTAINTWPELQNFLAGYNDTQVLKDILDGLVNDILGDPIPTESFRTLRGIEDFVRAMQSTLTNLIANLQKELNTTQEGVGLDQDGNYDPDQQTTYLKDATSVMSALRILDSLIARLVNRGSVYTVKGSVADLTALKAIQIVEKGDVYNVEAEVTISGVDYPAHNNFVYIGDDPNQASVESYWDSLGGMVSEGGGSMDVDDTLSLTSENPVQNKVITAALNRINAELFPLTITVSGGGVFEKRTSQTITVNWQVREGSDNTTPDTITVNNEPVTNTDTSKQFTEVTTNTTYTVKATKNGAEVQGSTSAIFVNPGYFGAVDVNFTPTEDAIKLLTKSVKNGRGYTGNISLNNQKTCYAYPKSFGALTAIKDANNFEYLNSYTRNELQVWDETYYVYVLTDATTIDNFRQIYS